MRVSRLSFAAEPHAVAGNRWVTPVVDGTPLTDLVADFEIAQGFGELAGTYAGIVVGADGRPLVGELLGDGRRSLLGCECGDTGCWPLEAEIRFDDWSVTWDGFAQPHRPRWAYGGFGPFVFVTEDYRAAVERFSAG
ncbi:hypothetical protein [Blastococcus goldschmidtiae]|uniref:ASCH domain-containing protein n=1 Tax=Blastococcus goldschmidtiae TaxID=3075546 RepID=A0ABU2K4Q7_9ACTN|nr:hypothetical protein [Blastococcus sp. DSM 46792]MDT0275196.1 hypothetical protein [Blastococcus sp. DSM 46792]